MKTFLIHKTWQAELGESFRQFRIARLNPLEDIPHSYHCGCQHDCCGHWQYDMYVTRLPFRFILVEEHHYMNV